MWSCYLFTLPLKLGKQCVRNVDDTEGTGSAHSLNRSGFQNETHVENVGCHHLKEHWIKYKQKRRQPALLSQQTGGLSLRVERHNRGWWAGGLTTWSSLRTSTNLDTSTQTEIRRDEENIAIKNSDSCKYSSQTDLVLRTKETLILKVNLKYPLNPACCLTGGLNHHYHLQLRLKLVICEC